MQACTHAYVSSGLCLLLKIVRFIYIYIFIYSHFLVGGAVLEDGDSTDLAQVYNPKTCAWTELAPMQIAHSGSAACTLKGKLYVIGVCVISSQATTHKGSNHSNKNKQDNEHFDCC